MPTALHMGLIYTMILLTSLVLVCIQIPWYTIVAVGLLVSFFIIQWYSSGMRSRDLSGFFSCDISCNPIHKTSLHSNQCPSISSCIGNTLRNFRHQSLPCCIRHKKRYVKIINDNHTALFNLVHINLYVFPTPFNCWNARFTCVGGCHFTLTWWECCSFSQQVCLLLVTTPSIHVWPFLAIRISSSHVFN